MPPSDATAPAALDASRPREGPPTLTQSPSVTRPALLPTLFVVLFAFLLASFPARTSDLLMHLAAGRQIAHGTFPFGGAAYHPWLFDLAAYAVYSVAGGAGLVAAKALLVAALALVLLRLSRAGAGWWVPVVCTTLAILAMGTRLLLQPATVSYLLLALTLWFVRPRLGRPASLLAPWPLAVLFVAWANVDTSFVLGLGAVALVWLGEVLDGSPVAGSRARLAAARAAWLAVLAAVCLLNPSHVHAFMVPWEQGAAASVATRSITSPFDEAYLTTVGVTPAGMAYFPLVVLGLFAFALNYAGWRWRRFLPWLGLAALSAAQVRTAPFFAVLAGPALAWNVQELFAVTPGRRPAAPARRGWAAGAAAAVLGLVALACAWTGWLQAPPYGPRQWAVEPPASLARGAEAVDRWHREGKLGPDDRGLHLSAESARAFAWFCRDEKGVLDDGLAAAVRGAPDAPRDWRQRMRAEGVNHVIVYEPDPARLFATLRRLLADPEQWPLLYLEGDLAVFGWRDLAAGGADRFAGWALDVDRLALHPAADKKAPRDRPDREPEPRRWWQTFWKPAPARPLDREESALHLFHAEALRPLAARRNLGTWDASQLAALVASAGSWSGPGGFLDAEVRTVFLWPPAPAPGSPTRTPPPTSRAVGAAWQRFVFLQGDTPPAPLYLAVRAARRAVAADPDDAQAYANLGEAYMRLALNTRERGWAQRMPELRQLRRVQASAALNRAVALRPDLAQAHLNLGWLYLEMNYLDLALKHLEAHRKLVHEAGPPPEMTAEQFREQEAENDQRLAGLAKTVSEREASYAAAASGLRVLDRAAVAVEKGLAGLARDVLLGSDVSAFGPPGMNLELELLLNTGRPKEVRDWTDPDQKSALGEGSFHWLRMQAFAASGDYGRAEEECDQIVAVSRGPNPLGPRGATALVVGRAVLDEETGLGLLPQQLWRALGRLEFQGRVSEQARRMKQEADVTALRGLLALERGDVEEADVSFRLALAFWGDGPASGGVDFNGRVIAQDCLAWME